MKNKSKKLAFMMMGLYAVGANAQDPIIQTKYTADPAPMVYNDTIFLYTSHDEDDAQGYDFKMLYGVSAITVHGHNKWWSAMVSFICIAPFMGTALAYWFPIRLMDLLKIP